MRKMIFAMFALVTMIGFQSCDSGEYLDTVEFYEADKSYMEPYTQAYMNDEIELSSDDVFELVCENVDRMKYAGECDIYENSEGQIIAMCNGENCVVMKLRKPYVARVAGIDTVTMYYKAGPYYMVSSPDYTSIFAYR